MAFAVALLGCEHPHVSDTLSVIASEPDVRLAAVWSEDRSAIPGPVSSYAVQSADAAISRADAVIVGATPETRPRLCVRAAQAGRPILVEEPLAPSAAEARAVAREISRSRTPAYGNLFLRQLPALGRLVAVLRADVLGPVTMVSASYLSPAALGMVDLGIHLLDALAALGARPRLDAIRLERRRGTSLNLGGVAVGTWGDVPLSLRVSSVARPGGLELTVNGARATAVLRDGTLELASEPGAPERWIGAPPDPAEAVRAFFARLRRRRLNLNGLQDAITAHEAIERATTL
jgi:predicted dehydrogenase